MSREDISAPLLVGMDMDLEVRGWHHCAVFEGLSLSLSQLSDVLICASELSGIKKCQNHEHIQFMS